jgi:hypothetical protein
MTNDRRLMLRMMHDRITRIESALCDKDNVRTELEFVLLERLESI